MNKNQERMRAFGITLKLNKNYENVLYEGSKEGVGVLVQHSDGGWIATLTTGIVTIRPDLYSSSAAAAVRNLRGHLLCLAMSLGSVGIRDVPKEKRWSKKRKKSR